MAAELILLPVLGLLIFGWAIFFASAAMYRRQVREDRAERLRLRWEGIFRAASGHRLALLWHDKEGWIATLCDAGPHGQQALLRAQLRGDTMTVTLGPSLVALDFRFLDEGPPERMLISPLVPGLHGDTTVEHGWLDELVQIGEARWVRE